MGGGLCQSVYDALAADAGIPGRPAPAADLVRTAGALAQHGDRRVVESGAALCQLDGDRLRLDLPCGVFWDDRRLRVFALSGAARRRPFILYPVDADDAADCGCDPDLSDVPAARTDRYKTRDDPALYRRQCIARGVAVEGIHG